MKVLKFGNADRISQLPDAVLGHILSYLPMKESVQTSVLSKRWKDAWVHAPVVIIDDSSLQEPEVGTYQAVHTSFINFVNNVFNLNKADSIHKFVLDCRLLDAFRVNDLVLGALRHRVRELDLCIANLEQFELGSRFAYQELVVLKLGQQFVLNVPDGVCFPSLEELHLSFVEFFDDDTVPNLVSNCPVLEHLSIYKCGMQNVEILDINAPALRILRIDTVILDDDDDDDGMSETCEFKVVVDAPNLKYLELNGNLAEGYCFKNLHSLVEADIDVDVQHVVEFKDSDFDACILDLVKGIANAKILRFSGYTLEAIHWVKVLGLPVFHNVTKMELGGNYNCGLLLPFLLQNSPNLEVLVIDEGIALKGDLNHFEWIPSLEVPECLSLHLKVVKIWGYQGQDAVCKFAKYVLSNGKVLNEFSADGTIQESVDKVEVSKKLLEGL